MEKKGFYLALVVVLLLASGFSFFLAFGELGFTGLTIGDSDPALNPPPITDFVDITSEDIAGSQSASSLEITNLQSEIDENKNAIIRMNANLQSLASQVAQLSARLDSQLGSINTGLAGLQQNVDSTKVDLENLQKPSLAKWLAIIFLIISLITLNKVKNSIRSKNISRKQVGRTMI